jgi:hypothetical protein
MIDCGSAGQHDNCLPGFDMRKHKLKDGPVFGNG